MSYTNQFLNSTLTETLWQETPDAETWNGRMWYGRFNEDDGGHVLTQESDGDGWVKRYSYSTTAALDAAWERIVNPMGNSIPEDAQSRPRSV